MAEGSSNPEVRDTMQKMGLWTRFKDAIKKIFHWGAMEPDLAKETGFEQSDALTEFDKTLDKFLDNFDKESYDKYVSMAQRGRHEMKVSKNAPVEDGRNKFLGEGPGHTIIDWGKTPKQLRMNKNQLTNDILQYHG